MLQGVLLQAPLAAIQAIFRIVLMVGVGALVGRYGKLSSDFLRSLNAITSSVFLPCLLLSRVAETATAERIIEWWPLPVFAILYVVIGCGLGWILAKTVRCERREYGFYCAAVAFPNNTSIPLSVVETLALSSPSLLSDTLQPLNGDKISLVERGDSYILVFTLFTTILRWTVGYALLEPDSQLRDVDDPIEGESRRLTWRQRLRKALRTPPIIASLFSLLIGLIPQVKELFFDTSSPVEHVIVSAARTFGAATVPSILLLLGLSLSNGPPPLTNSEKLRGGSDLDKTHEEAGLTKAGLSVIVIGKMLLK